MLFFRGNVSKLLFSKDENLTLLEIETEIQKKKKKKSMIKCLGLYNGHEDISESTKKVVVSNFSYK